MHPGCEMQTLSVTLSILYFANKQIKISIANIRYATVLRVDSRHFHDI